MGHVCVSGVPVPVSVCACTCFCVCLWAYPHCPTTHLPCGRGRSCCPRTSDERRQQTTHITHPRTHDEFRRHGKRRQTGKDTQDIIIIIHHHHFTATPGMSLCRFFPSPAYSESSPRGGCTPCLLSVPGEGTLIQHKSPRLTRLTPLPPPSGPFTVYERPRLPVWSPLPFIISSLRTLSTRYPSTQVAQSSPALPCPAFSFDALVLETSNPCSLCTSDLTPPPH